MMLGINGWLHRKICRIPSSRLRKWLYFQEQYYDSFVQMLNEEMWDACDAWENKLGYKVPRSMAKSLADGVFHVVVMIYTVTTDGRVLVTQRSQKGRLIR